MILKSGITLWEIQDNHIIPQQLGVDSVANNGHQRFEFYFETENIAQIHDDLNALGVEFLHTLHEEPWGQRTIRFFDPDRHLVEIGESMKTFVKRLHQEGMNSEQIAKKTSIPFQEVKNYSVTKCYNKEIDLTRWRGPIISIVIIKYSKASELFSGF